MQAGGSDDRILQIYRETLDEFYGYVSRRCGGDRELSEDITQETWLRAAREWSQKGIPDRPIAWLTTVARNLMANLGRRKPDLALGHTSAEEMIDAIDTGRAYESKEIATIVNDALARMPESQSRLIEEFHYENRRVSQIAEESGLSERAVEGRLRRARENLRKELEAALGTNGGPK